MPGKSVIAKRKVCNMTPEVKERIAQIQNGNVPAEYKHTKAGIYPEDWVEVTLGDIYTERKESGNESLPLLMVSIHSGVSDGEVDEEDLPKKVKRIEDKSQYKRAAVGDLVFNMMRAWQGAIGSVRTEGMVSPAYIVAEPNDMVDPLFMDSYMKTNRMVHTIHRQSYGVTDFRLRLYWESFAPIPCVLPPIREQKKIAEILTTQDKVIELEQQEIEEIMKVKQFFLGKMFPKKGQALPEIRFKGFTGAWEQRSFKECFDLLANNTLSRAELCNEHGTVRNVHYGDILVKFGEMIDLETESLPYISVTATISKTSCLQNGDVIIADTAEDSTVGKCAEMTGISGTEVVSGLHTIPCRPRKQFAQGYLGYFMNAPAYHDQLLPLMQGTKVTSVSKAALQDTVLCYPSDVEEQALIGHYFMSLDNLITLHQRKLEEEKRKKKALMQLLLTGIVRV